MAEDRNELTHGKLRLRLAPGVGGAIESFEWIESGNTTPIMRPVDGTLGHVLEAASFPLVPYVNRVRGGRFTFRGREVRIAPNMAGDPSPLHGQGWLNPWRVEEAGDVHARLSFHHQPGEWPWAYAATQDFSLTERGLTAVITCRNLADDPMPCGLG